MAQVVAGIFGLTIAGYTFLRNQQDRLVDKDDTLIEIFERIQGNQHHLVEYITALSVASIFSALLVIALRDTSHENIKSSFLDFTSALFVTSLLWTAYFAIEVTRPEKISNASKMIKDEIALHAHVDDELGGRSIDKNSDDLIPVTDNYKDKNHFSEFMRYFNSMENYLVSFAEFNFGSKSKASADFDLNPDMQNKKSIHRSGVNLPISKIVKALLSDAVINKKFSDEILDIIRYRNALVHGQDLSVDANMLSRIIAAVEQLRLSIEKHYSSRREG